MVTIGLYVCENQFVSSHRKQLSKIYFKTVEECEHQKCPLLIYKFKICGIFIKMTSTNGWILSDALISSDFISHICQRRNKRKLCGDARTCMKKTDLLLVSCCHGEGNNTFYLRLCLGVRACVHIMYVSLFLRPTRKFSAKTKSSRDWLYGCVGGFSIIEFQCSATKISSFRAFFESDCYRQRTC